MGSAMSLKSPIVTLPVMSLKWLGKSSGVNSSLTGDAIVVTNEGCCNEGAAVMI